MLNCLLVMLGGAGTGARFWASWLRELAGPSLSILLVNVTGSFVIGFFATLTHPSGRYLVAPGLRTNLW